MRGNVNWMHARQSIPESPLFGDDLDPFSPSSTAGRRIVPRLSIMRIELLVQSGRSLPHAVAMLIPGAWDGNPNMEESKKAFYEYHHCSLMEPWDSPAAITFTDGRVIGATLDRNGLRPRALRGHARWSRGAGIGNRRTAD